MVSLAEEVSRVKYWRHSIDLGHGIVTPGFQTPENHEFLLRAFRLPDLHGMTFLDVGAWDGYYSFAAERMGASRVVALDHYVWEQPQFGKDGFDLAHRVLKSRVEVVWDDFMTTDLTMLGTFDVVLFSGILYHLQHPLLALQRLVEVTAGSAFIETHAVCIEGYEDLPLIRFYETNELADDSTNWWGPTLPALEAMCRAAGFRAVEILLGPEWADLSKPVANYRAIVRADR
jgi:tRNA (mo5U34)-methyltransferase